MTHYTRGNWGARSAVGGPGQLDVQRVEGLALHWPGVPNPVRGFESVSAALRNMQREHMEVRGWSDIGYQIAVDQDGNTYTLRGMQNQSAANGSSDVNRRYGAFLLILAVGEQPSPQMIAAVQQMVREFRCMYPNGTRIVGHGEIRPGPTECPGPFVRAMISRGAFEPPVPRTRGKQVDAAIDDLKQARGKGRRARLLKKAMQALKRIGYIGGGK